VRQAELGEVVSPVTPIVTLADLDHLWVRVYVSGDGSRRTALGQVVDVHTILTRTGFIMPGFFHLFRGGIHSKSVQTEKSASRWFTAVKVDVDNPNRELKPGMPADTMIKTEVASTP